MKEMGNIFGKTAIIIWVNIKMINNGKGILYYNNGKIEYEGEFINDKYEENGKYIW